MKRSILITIDDEVVEFLDIIRYEYKTPKSAFINRVLLEVQKSPKMIKKLIEDLKK
jgi:hypothetical protein